MWSNGIKTAFFQKITKNRPAAGLSPQTPKPPRMGAQPPDPLKFNTSPNLDIPPKNKFLVTCQHQLKAFDLPFYDIFAPTKNFFFEVSDDVIVFDLGLPQSKILATPMNYGNFITFFKVIFSEVISLLLCSNLPNTGYEFAIQQVGSA